MGFSRRRSGLHAIGPAVVIAASIGQALGRSAAPPSAPPLPPTREAVAPVRPAPPLLSPPLPPRREPADTSPRSRAPQVGPPPVVPPPPVRPPAVAEAQPKPAVPLPPVAGRPAPPVPQSVDGQPRPAARAIVPLPPVRPTSPSTAEGRAAAMLPRAPLSGPTLVPVPAPAPPSAALPGGPHEADPDCRALASEGVAVFEARPAFGSASGCGAAAPVELTAIRRPDGGLVKLEPAATLRCGMARAVSAYVREDLVPAAAAGGATLDQVDVAASYDCRGRNRARGAKLSEHGRANAFDIRGFGFSDGRDFGVYSPSLPGRMRAVLMPAACARFSTVLGPGSDGYHEDHLHMDLQQRRRAGSKHCRWRGV